MSDEHIFQIQKKQKTQKLELGPRKNKFYDILQTDENDDKELADASEFDKKNQNTFKRTPRDRDVSPCFNLKCTQCKKSFIVSNTILAYSRMDKETFVCERCSLKTKRR